MNCLVECHPGELCVKHAKRGGALQTGERQGVTAFTPSSILHQEVYILMRMAVKYSACNPAFLSEQVLHKGPCLRG